MKKIKVGIIGCGMVAQTMHLPYLKELEEQFEIKAICDISPRLLKKIGDFYGIKERYTDYRKLLDSGIDAVLVLTINHAEVVVAAAKAGKHIFVEKPLCNNLEEADKILKVVEDNKVKLMVGYMKRFDPGYLYGKELIRKMRDIRLIRLHTVIGPNNLFLDDIYRIYRYNDVSPRLIEEAKIKEDESYRTALGNNMTEILKTAYGLLLHLSTHDLSILRGIFGVPKKIISADIWADGLYYTAIMDYGNDLKCVFDTGLVMELKEFDEEMAVFSKDKIVKIQFPSPFIKNAPTHVRILEMEKGAFIEKKVLASYEESFKKELEHFYDCLVNDKKPLTDGKDGREDIELALDIINAYERNN